MRPRKTRAAKDADPLNKRFIRALDALGHSGYTACRVLGTSQAVISNIRCGKNPPNVRLVQRLLKRHPRVSADWLLLGKGAMWRAR